MMLTDKAYDKQLRRSRNANQKAIKCQAQSYFTYTRPPPHTHTDKLSYHPLLYMGAKLCFRSKCWRKYLDVRENM